MCKEYDGYMLILTPFFSFGACSVCRTTVPVFSQAVRDSMPFDSSMSGMRNSPLQFAHHRQSVVLLRPVIRDCASDEVGMAKKGALEEDLVGGNYA